MKRPCLALLLSCLAMAPALSQAAPVPPGSAASRSLVLKNGLHAILIPDPRASAVNVSVWYPAGPGYERPGTHGISHLVERLSSFGAAPGGMTDLRRRVEAEGGTTTAYTAADYTCYTHTVPRTGLATVLRLEAGRLGVRLTQAMLDREREALRQELRAPVSVIERGLRQMYATAFAEHPYRWPALGSEDELGNITLADCETFLKARYAPDQALIVIVGDFDPDQASGDLRREFEMLASHGEKHELPAATEPTQERRAVASGDVPVPVLVVGWRVPASAAQDGPALDVLATLLAGEFAAPQADQASGQPGRGWVARTGRDARRGANMFWAASAARSVADTAAVEQWLVRGVEKLAGEPITDQALDRARRQLEVGMLLGRQSTLDRGQAAGASQMIAGDWTDDARRAQRLLTLTPADLQQAAARTLVPSRRTVVWLIPAPAGTGGAGGHP